MKLRIILLAALVSVATGASAQSVFDKISKGVSKAGDAVKGATNSVGNTIDSTSELISDEETPELTRQRLDATAETTLQRLFSENEAAKLLFDLSAGYAVFDTRRVAILGVAAGFGRGVAVSNLSETRTYMNMGTGGLGLSFGLGGFDRQVVILFEEAGRFQGFVDNGYDATAESGAMFGDDKADQTVRFIDGRSVFVLTNKGWIVSASAAGTKYWADPDLN